MVTYIKDRNVNHRKSGLTLIELLVVLGIITLLVGILVPALSMVHTKAKETKQFAQFTAINLGLTTFKSDYGDFPPSNITSASPDYCGAQKLAEALLGWDLLGFQPRSSFTSNGINYNNEFVYDANNTTLFDQRKDRYVEASSSDVFRLGDISVYKPGLYNLSDIVYLEPDTYVLCDVFGRKKIQTYNGGTVNAGSPILYYRANTSAKTIREIYDPTDNDAIIQTRERVDDRGGNAHPLGLQDNDYKYFYDYIRDPKISARAWPYKSDSYILISAGEDGLYGTSDDIRNFGN
ncbi:type II secretion system protein [Planctomycetota bacterium]